MNCINHPELPAAAYCQNCGKPLCTGCLRSVGGVIYCEPCLAARLSPAGAGGVYAPPATGMPANPMLAGLLGFIPGVGAMYNGQYVKALAHVLIFAVFVSLSDKSFVFGLLVAAWIFYQVFDAGQTAKARRDGLPLPNPFGLNDLGTKMGMTPTPVAPPYVPPPPAAYDPAGPVPSPGFSPGPPASYTTSYVEPPAVYTPPVPAPLPAQQRTPVGAIVLIAIGVMLLLQTLGVFEEEWLGRAWPLIIIGVGAWLLYRRTHETPRGGGL